MAVWIPYTSGDLAHRKLVPGILSLVATGVLPEEFAIVGFSRRPWDKDQFRTSLRQSLESSGQEIDEGAWEWLAQRLDFVPGTFESAEDFQALRQRLIDIDVRQGTAGNRIFYLATPPSGFPPILEHLATERLISLQADKDAEPFARVVIEKPFGRDLASARELNRLVASLLDEKQVFRIDHYLGKETVQNILVFRLGNTIFEPIWNRNHIDHVQITAAETLGMEGRGRFYDRTGVLRDIVQNHLLQVMALCAMEPPVSFRADDLRDQKVNVFRSLRPICGDTLRRQLVWGQYDGYAAEPNVAPSSRTPTFVALRLFIDNWRWQGVPFYLRAGKRLKKRLTEVAIHFKTIPFCLFGDENVCQRIQPNVLTLRIQPDEGIHLRIASKVPGDSLTLGSVSMDFSYRKAFRTKASDAYQRLLLDALRGDATLFTRRDGVEEAWRFVTPILEDWESRTTPPPTYARGTDGPSAAAALLARDGRRWRPLA